MNLVHLPNYWKGLPKSISFAGIVIATCLLYLSGVVNGEPSDWRMTVPKNTMKHASYSHHQRHHISSKDSQPIPIPSARSESSRRPHHQHSPPLSSPTFSSRLSDPRMGYFYTDTTSKTSSSTSVIPRPRSLSLSASPSSTSTSSRKTKRDSKTKTNEVTTRKSHEDSGTSRTFLITPFLATMAPVFLAQMFGMSMIPAAGLILLPVFLLPLALTMAVFLV